MLALPACRAAAPHAPRAAPRRPRRGAACSAANSGHQRRKPSAADFARAQLAVDALLHAAVDDTCDAYAGESAPQASPPASPLEERIAEVAALGAELGLDRVGPIAWNAGTFQGHALQGRLRRVLSAPLTLPALSFGLFTLPGEVLLLPDAPSRILKGAAGRSRLPRGYGRSGDKPDPADSRADRYAVQTPFILRRPGGRPPLRGVNTVLGTFGIGWDDDDAPRELRVQFTRVRLSLTKADADFDAPGDDEADALLGVHERALPAPARATLRVLLMTPTAAVTRSDQGSVAVLTRCDAA